MFEGSYRVQSPGFPKIVYCNEVKNNQQHVYFNTYTSPNYNRQKHHIFQAGTPKQQALCGEKNYEIKKRKKEEEQYVSFTAWHLKNLSCRQPATGYPGRRN